MLKLSFAFEKERIRLEVKIFERKEYSAGGGGGGGRRRKRKQEEVGLSEG